MADLPEPWGHGENITGTAFSSNLMGMWKPQARTRFPLPLFTADQLEAYAAARVAEERERCARLCESRTKYATPDEYDQAALDCAAAIRGTEAASA